MLTCRELCDFLNDYVDGTLESRQRQAFEEHMCECQPCIEFLSSYRLAIELGREAVCCCDERLPTKVPERIIQAIMAARAHR